MLEQGLFRKWSLDWWGGNDKMCCLGWVDGIEWKRLMELSMGVSECWIPGMALSFLRQQW